MHTRRVIICKNKIKKLAGKEAALENREWGIAKNLRELTALLSGCGRFGKGLYVHFDIGVTRFFFFFFFQGMKHKRNVW